MNGLLEAVGQIDHFKAGNLKHRIASIEEALENKHKNEAEKYCASQNVNQNLLKSAMLIKGVSSQIDSVVHAVGMLILLPIILKSSEQIEKLALGADNTGKNFDLETNFRVAEFKFIHWKGGPQSSRKKELFKDFFDLAEENTTKERDLYLLDLAHPVKFFNSQTAISSILSRNNRLLTAFINKYGSRFETVSQYLNYRKQLVNLINIYDIAKSFST